MTRLGRWRADRTVPRRPQFRPQRPVAAMRKTERFGRVAKSERPLVLAVAALVVVAGLLGGGPGTNVLPFAVISLAGAFLIFMAVWNDGLKRFQQLPKIIGLSIILLVITPFLQLIPLPPSVWQLFPGQELRSDILALAELQNSWQPLSMAPLNTLYAAVFGLILFALLVALLRLSPEAMTIILAVQIAVIFVGIAVGLIQFMSGGSALQIYRQAHHGALIGLFANKNHMGLALACLIPLGYELLARRIVRPSGLIFGMALMCATAMVLIVVTNSRAAILLGVMASAIVALRHWPEKRLLSSGIMAMGLALVVVAGFSLPTVAGLWERLGDAGEDVRWTIIVQSLPLVDAVWPMGAGIGSFRFLYDTKEQLEWVTVTYVNNVHNDYIEWIIETGILGLAGLILIFAALVISAARSPQVRALGAAEAYGSYALTGLTIIVLFSAHSLADYPIRRFATAIILVMGVAMLLRDMLPGRPKGTAGEDAP